MELPSNYQSYQETVNPFAFMDVNLIPFNCVVEVNFHHKLQGMTLVPIVFLGWVFCMHLLFHAMLYLKDKYGQTHVFHFEHRVLMLRAKAVYVAIVCLYSVFPLVSAVIFQTVSYDRRLPPDEFLKADYSVKSSDPAHQANIVYAAVMGVVYMAGIPVTSFLLLYTWKDSIQRLQTLAQRILCCNSRETALKVQLQEKYAQMLKDDPFLEGLSPLYQDYQSKYYLWEIPRFFCIEILCGLVTVTNFQDGSQIAASLLVSTAMLVAYANCNPYLTSFDDHLAQFCQSALSLAFGVGLLAKANSPSIPDSEFKGHVEFGYVLIFCMTINLTMGCGGILLDFMETFLPLFTEKYLFFLTGKKHHTTSKSERRLGRSIRASRTSIVVPQMVNAPGSEESPPTDVGGEQTVVALPCTEEQALVEEVREPSSLISEDPGSVLRESSHDGGNNDIAYARDTTP
jgi:hypothetical protein